RRRNAAAVERDHLAFARVIQHHKRIASKAALHRQNHAFRSRNGDRRVECIASALKNAETDESRHRVGGAHHAARAERVGPLLDARGFGRAQTPGTVVYLHIDLLIVVVSFPSGTAPDIIVMVPQKILDAACVRTSWYSADYALSRN